MAGVDAFEFRFRGRRIDSMEAKYSSTIEDFTLYNIQ